MCEDEVTLPGGPPAVPAEGERRAAVRHLCGRHGPTRLVVEYGHAAHWARPHDVSVGGIRLLLAHALEPGAELTVQPRSDPERPARPLSAVVVHARAEPDGTWTVGCAFTAALTVEEFHQFL